MKLAAILALVVFGALSSPVWASGRTLRGMPPGPGKTAKPPPGPVVILHRAVNKNDAVFEISSKGANAFFADCSVPSTVVVRDARATVRVPGLTEGVSYECYVWASSPGGDGPWMIINFTASDVQPLPKPKLKSVATTRTGATILTSTVGGAAKYKAVCYEEGRPTQHWATISVSGVVVRARVGGLRPGAKHMCSIVAFRKTGPNGFPLDVSFKTKK